MWCVKRIGAWGVALGVVVGCGDGEPGAPAADTDPAEETGTSGSVDPTTGTSEGDSSGAVDPTVDPPLLCPEPDPIQTVDGLEHRGRGEGASFIEILDLEARGDFVYGCTGTQGLSIWDVATDTGELMAQSVGPALLAHPQFPRCQHIALDADGRRAVLTNRGDEVQPTPWLFVYDVEDPTSPMPLRGWTGEASIEGAVWSGDRIYVAAHTAGILVFEDTGGDMLEQVGSFADEASDAWLPILRDDLLYVAEGGGGLRIYDISADDPVPIGSVTIDGSSRDLARAGDTVYVAASSSVVAVDVSDPTNPSVVAESPTAGTSVAIGLGVDELIYSAEWDEVRAYDATTLERVWSEVVPTGDDFSRVLTLATHPERTRVYAGEWTGMHMFESLSGATAPEVASSPTSVQYGRVEPGDFEDRVVVIRNEGDQTLEVFGFESDSATITIDEPCFSIEPGGLHAAELRFEPESLDVRAGAVRLLTNDPDEEEFEIRFAGNASGADVGEPMPEFMLQDLDGNDWTNADLDGKVVVLAYFATF